MAQKLDFDHKKVKYSLKDDGRFIIENYNFSKPFSSFFPGIAGLYGIPMWVFYVNRGQGIASFGINSKDHPLLEFFPADKTYEMVSRRGFRTFIKLKKNNNITYYEPFQNSLSNLVFQRKNRIVINFSELGLEEENLSLGLNVRVNYFTIPSDNFAGLVRILSIKNTSRKPQTIELIDGLPIIIPYGLSNMFLKKLSRTIEAWMGVENLENNAAFYRLKVDPTDRPEIIHIKKGNFYLSFYEQDEKATLLKPIVDPECVFGRVTDLSFPYLFLKENNFTYPRQQIVQSRTPSALSFIKTQLKKDEEFVLYSVCGNMDYLEKLNRNIKRIAKTDYIKSKQKENNQIVASIMQNAATLSSSDTFNLYAKGTFLDNVMRGGLPITLDKEKGEVVYVYSRKHGDLERDYNKFVTQPTYFSQGNGNYRDINQNRRNDIFFNPELKEANIVSFLNFIQLDGFNPLVIKGISYHIEDKDKISKILRDYLDDNDKNLLSSFLSKPFYIGELFMWLEEHNINIKGDKNEFIKKVLSFSIKQEDAEYKEGFWTDHWTYNLDLIESYLAVYPEKLKYILLDKKEFTFYDDCWTVNPRIKKYVLYGINPRQLNAVAISKEKQVLIEGRKVEPHKVRIDFGKGEIYKTNLLEKFICIILNKLASLDPFGVGIEMEANKPDWYDALNGLPALLGSSISETMELKRLILFIEKSLKELGLKEDSKIEMAEEFFEFYNGLSQLLEAKDEDSQEGNFVFWDKSYSLKEEYREKTILGLSGKEKQISLSDFMQFLNRALAKVERAICKSYNPKDKTYNTYFINEIEKFERIGEDKEVVFIKPLKFRQKALPLFLEGFVHALKITDKITDKKSIYEAVRRSKLYDNALGMYKVNAPLEGQPEEIGRARVFTPGWLENESVWLHMEYKYLLELLESGLHDEFYKDFFRILIPFQDPQRYGRSILENSSFLVSSAFPDAKLHGNGFVARLSGSTSEFLHIWLLMNVGVAPFFLDGKGKLCLRFQPILHKDLFTKKEIKFNYATNGDKEVLIEKNCYAFNFLGNTLVVYHNPKRLNTYGNNAAKIKKIILEDRQNKKHEINSDLISPDYSYNIRLAKFFRIDIYLS
ncbi:MAG: hypothetical protein PHS93_01930 [Candidatus Omnitrophica bacterium]|nr:hypothetical protein [Candidatus Omnitrophota bacterium]MDD5351912.1 hypothetical protein [Candidatus Omnitrophota bacterium]MDD5550738.1 hypothetical protein [Candidatus Omnitrophota bacterium]